eukprot:8996175-Pyramimonas_sp.AAC.1
MGANGTPGSPMGHTEPKLATTEYSQSPVFESTKMALRWHWGFRVTRSWFHWVCRVLRAMGVFKVFGS